MTREDAKTWLNKLYARADITNEYGDMEDMQPYEEAVDMAIKALEQEPCEDCDYSEIMDWEQDTKTGKAKPIYWCERHKEPCDDAISRQAALDCFTATKLKKFDFILHAREEIKKLPSVTQMPKTGHWEDLHRCWICSECNQETHVEYKFCPYCGAKMVEPQERSE